jgi:hypothetical protein
MLASKYLNATVGFADLAVWIRKSCENFYTVSKPKKVARYMRGYFFISKKSLDIGSI